MSWVQDPPPAEPPLPDPAVLPEPPAAPSIPSPPWAEAAFPAPVGSDGAPTVQRTRMPAVVGAVAGIAVIAAVAGGIAVARHSSHTAHDVSFATPTGWHEFPQATFRAQEGAPLRTRTVGVDSNNLVVIQTYLLNVKVDAGNLDSIRSQVDSLMHQLTAESGGSILSGPVPTTLGGLPGFQYQVSTLDPSGIRVESRVVFAFLEQTEYFMNCQHTATHAAEIEAGCDQISRSFRPD
jgi:hypothetical protein